MGKQDWPNAFSYMEKSMDAFQEELGRHDPVTNGTKTIFGSMMFFMYPHRAFPRIQEAFNDNGEAPEDKRIENMDMVTILLEIITNDDDARIWFFKPEIHKQLLNDFHAFKETLKKQ